MDVDGGESGTGLNSVGPTIKPEIGTLLGWHGNQPIAISSFMLTLDAGDEAQETWLSRLLTHYQSSSSDIRFDS